MADAPGSRDDLVDVGAVDDFEPGVIALREFRGREVAVVRWSDEIFAVGNDCPHQGGPLCHGHVFPYMEGHADGELVSNADRPVIACSWHGWEFDLRDGSSVWDDSVRVRVYKVEIVGDRVLLGSMGARRARNTSQQGAGSRA
jgi:nitrite reductase (NADH) small subunit